MTETIGIAGYPAAGTLTDTPELVNYDRKRGYPWMPFDVNPESYIPGASSIGKAVGGDWSWWARRVCARTGAKLRKELAEYSRAEDAEQRLYKAAEEVQWGPANNGSTVHMHTALQDAGRQIVDPLPDHLAGHVESWQEFKRRHHVRFGAIERTGYAPEFGYGAAGTIDRLCAVQRVEGSAEQLAVLDLKSKNQPLSRLKPDLSHLIQIVALAQSRYIAIEEQHTLVEIPKVTAAIIVYLARDGYRAYWINPHLPELIEFTKACIATSALKAKIGNGGFGRPEVVPLNQPVPGLVEAPPQPTQEEPSGQAQLTLVQGSSTPQEG